MATAREIRSLIEKTTTGTRARSPSRATSSLRNPERKPPVDRLCANTRE